MAHRHIDKYPSMKIFIVLLFAASIAYVHFRGRVRHKITRQLGDHSSFLAPVNAFLYLFSKLPARPYLPTESFPELAVAGQLAGHPRRSPATAACRRNQEFAEL